VRSTGSNPRANPAGITRFQVRTLSQSVRRKKALFWPNGEYADACWKEVPQHHPHVDIDEFVVMPNHMHVIVILGGPERMPEMQKQERFKRVAKLDDVRPKVNSLGTVVGSFKSVVKQWCVAEQVEFEWQPRFHDRIIRGKNSLKAIREYIRDNPANWNRDEFYKA
jgi:putative transposase